MIKPIANFLAVSAIWCLLAQSSVQAGVNTRPTAVAEPNTSVVAPGVWRIRIGDPDTLGVPSAYRVVQPNIHAMDKLPAVKDCALDAAKIQSLVTTRNLRLEIPYDSEIIYGLGLQGDTFQQQKLMRVLMNNCSVLCKVYGAKPAPFVLYEDDGETFDYQRGAQNRVTLSWKKESVGKVDRKGNFAGARYNVIEWK